MNKNIRYGSDLIVDILKQHDIDYISCNPGASFRGIHDSIINYSYNKKPKLIMCCHEEISVAIAHGYAKASEKYMAVLVHANIGLQHASMAIFNAWCDRVPILIIGGIGPLDVTKRRPWIDWIHTSNNQDNIIRDYVKWCDQPYNLASVPQSLYRACRILNTDPKAPVYVGIDSTIQEEDFNEKYGLKDIKKYSPPVSPSLDYESFQKISEMLINAEFPLIIVDYMGRNSKSVQLLQSLVELLSIPVVDRGGRYNFPTNHPFCLTGMGKKIYQKVDFILALDVHDLQAALGEMEGEIYSSYLNQEAKIAHVTLSDSLISNWAADYYHLYPVDISMAADSYKFLKKLISVCRKKIKFNFDKTKRYQERAILVTAIHDSLKRKWLEIAISQSKEMPLAVSSVLHEIWDVIQNEKWVLTNNGGVEVGKWIKKLWSFNRIGCYLGESGGAGLGYGLGASIGAALAHKDSDNLCINIQADGDFLFTPSALWTAAHYEVPLLIIMMNNRCYNNSKEHAVTIAHHRQREIRNAKVGTCFENPMVNFPLMAHSFGIFSVGTVEKLSEIKPALRKAIEFIKRENKPALIDIVIQ